MQQVRAGAQVDVVEGWVDLPIDRRGEQQVAEAVGPIQDPIETAVNEQLVHQPLDKEPERRRQARQGVTAAAQQIGGIGGAGGEAVIEDRGEGHGGRTGGLNGQRIQPLQPFKLDRREEDMAEVAEGERGAGEGGQDAARDVAVLFGRERYGLTNEEMQRCHFLVNIPANPEYSSLNIAQAVQIIAYELRAAALGITDISVDPPDWKPVDGVEMERFFEHLERTLLEIKFLNPKQPKRLMARLRRLYNRARPDHNEINILRGILTATLEAAEKDREAP